MFSSGFPEKLRFPASPIWHDRQHRADRADLPSVFASKKRTIRPTTGGKTGPQAGPDATGAGIGGSTDKLKLSKHLLPRGAGQQSVLDSPLRRSRVEAASSFMVWELSSSYQELAR